MPSIRCGGCVRRIEDSLAVLPGVRRARANLTTRRVRVEWEAGVDTPDVIDTLESVGFPATVQDTDGTPETEGGRELARHVKALAVAGFAAGNVMMLSIAVWSGADDSVSRGFHLLSAAIALPALAYAGRLFFLPAWEALRHGHVNMDVPISIGLLLTAAMSVYDTLDHGQAVYFDAALMLVFFLLVGRTLDQRMRERARHAADAVSRFEPRGAEVLQPDGSVRFEPLATLRVGERLSLAPGERLAVDGIVERGRSTVDRSLVSGESLPVDVAPGARLQAGTLNLGASLVVRATADANDSFLASIRRMMQEAETTKGRYRRIADRAAALYAPVVHVAAALSLIGWYALSGDLHRATSIAVAVLIITCPCALGLAVPVVQVIAARRLFEAGVLMKDGAALERLADVKTVIFDKTGTLTTGRAAWTQTLAEEVPRAAGRATTGARTIGIDTEVAGAGAPSADAASSTLAIARALARTSDHPHARSLMSGPADGPDASPPSMDGVSEIPGAGIEAHHDRHVYRLGRADWALERRAERALERRADEAPGQEPSSAAARTWIGSSAVLSRDGRELATYRFDDTPRADARRSLDALAAQGLDVELLSGDRAEPVATLAARLGIERARAGVLPADKLARVQALQADGHGVLMVGDGVNDSPALAAASVSIAPGSATETGRRAADFLLLQDRLLGVPDAVGIARRAHRLVRANIRLAILYNVLAMPLAIAGLVTPLVAAVSMSLSSVLVVANALRLTRGEERAR